MLTPDSDPTPIPLVLRSLSASQLVECSPQVTGRQISVEFSQEPPQEPGVYVVYLLDGEIPFYVGESRNLRQRLTFLFRCHRSENPHPCHRRHDDVWEVLPDCATFCERYGVRWYSTAGAFGRLEAEEALQQHLRTNRKEYYSNFASVIENHTKPAETSIAAAGPTAGLPSPGVADMERECCSTKGCNSSCPSWQELITNSAYQRAQGFQVPTMTGRKEPLLFRRDEENDQAVIRVCRASGSLNFTFNEHDCRAICERFDAEVRQGRSFATGGTASFNARSWINRPLTIITAPYAAAVIRHARQNLGLPV